MNKVKALNGSTPQKDNTLWWVIGGASAALGTGALIYFLFFTEKNHSYRAKGPTNRIKTKKENKSGSTGTGTGTAIGSTLSEPNWNNPFDMNYEQDVVRWVKPKRIQLLHPSEASQLAQTLYEAKGSSWWANDDEQAVKTIFQKRLKDKVQVATLSRAFWVKYKKDLWEYLNGFLSKSELNNYVHQPVKRLPNYRFA
ncbi:MAG: hypothetical protein R8G66_06085 [Cytophagales bacterium]|nr:hypothetical protein [Cytophagales bacterium]